MLLHLALDYRILRFRNALNNINAAKIKQNIATNGWFIIMFNTVNPISKNVNAKKNDDVKFIFKLSLILNRYTNKMPQQLN